jgi:alkylation response protein AidB-like acyl-CoA dehydrogenase
LDLTLTDDQRLIQDNARAVLTDMAGLERLRAVIASPEGWDAALWATLAEGMGFAGLMIPEAYGGAGLGAAEMALVLEETGRTLAVVPFFETAVLCAQAVLAVADEAQKAAILPGIAAGRTRAVLAFTGPAGRPFPDGVEAQLTREGDAWRLAGEASFVTFAHVADLLLVVARGARGDLSLVALPAAGAGVSIERLPNLDLTRPFSRVRFDRVLVPSDAVLGEPGAAMAGLDRAVAIAAGLLAAEQTGGAAFCLASTVDYAQQRIQFGRPIGSFQAVKHTLADMMVAVEAARSAALYAATAIDEGGDELFEAAAAARSWCSDAYSHCAAEAIQLHGGIGFTWEHHAHLHFKRARSSSTWLGEPALHRERIARLIGLDETAETL